MRQTPKQPRLPVSGNHAEHGGAEKEKMNYKMLFYVTATIALSRNPWPEAWYNVLANLTLLGIILWDLSEDLYKDFRAYRARKRRAVD